MGNVQLSESIIERVRREAPASGKDVNGPSKEAAELLQARDAKTPHAHSQFSKIKPLPLPR